ncbi:aminoglycoside phosphotransferase family protein [Krasilnikoviella flava]|uniref:Phosphotransferase enzyme family protein n=1 Tax=Krasilnikoviella flava TaxID=526729 RepID=A0A1T5LQ08_9MICO|nr:aminoglycoside phosphotransferase family protein [Krasilnikoviella flava]SKC78056.1 Phosphotransferase enzyme family protein [Krasilnikoviella flava]
MTAVPLSRTRPAWPDLPAPVRAGIEARLAAPVTAWTSHDGGYSQGLASTLRTADGPVFVKTVGPEHAFTVGMYREEARRAALLPAGVPAPRLLWSADLPSGGEDDSGDGAGGTWVALAFETVASRNPATPWVDEELQVVLDLAVAVGEHPVPDGGLPAFETELPTDRTQRLAAEAPAGLATYDPWLIARLDRLAEIELDAAAAVAGSSLVHGDLRGDNALLVAPPDGPPGATRALAVDWPNAARGAAFCDLVGMLPAVEVEGGPLPEEVLSRRPLPAGTDEDAVTAYLVALAGYFVHSSLQPPPPGIPHVRAFQRAQGEACVAWLRRLLR